MEISIDMKDIAEIEKNYEKIANWLTSHFTSFAACAFVLQSLIDAVDEAKAKLEGEEDE